MENNFVSIQETSNLTQKEKEFYFFLLNNLNKRGFISGTNADLAAKIGLSIPIISSRINSLVSKNFISTITDSTGKNRKIFLYIPSGSLYCDCKEMDFLKDRVLQLQKSNLCFLTVRYCDELINFQDEERNFSLVDETGVRENILILTAFNGYDMVRSWIDQDFPFDISEKSFVLELLQEDPTNYALNFYREKLSRKAEISIIKNKFEAIHKLLGEPYNSLKDAIMSQEKNTITLYERGVGRKVYRVSLKRLKAFKALLDEDSSDDIDF